MISSGITKTTDQTKRDVKDNSTITRAIKDSSSKLATNTDEIEHNVKEALALTRDIRTARARPLQVWNNFCLSIFLNLSPNFSLSFSRNFCHSNSLNLSS